MCHLCENGKPDREPPRMSNIEVTAWLFAVATFHFILGVLVGNLLFHW